MAITEASIGVPTQVEILEWAKTAAAKGELVIRKQARQHMQERSLKIGDINWAITKATRVTPHGDAAWRLSGGADTDDETFDIVVELRWEAICVVTIL